MESYNFKVTKYCVINLA